MLWLFAHRNEWDFRAVKNWTEDFFEIHNMHCSVMLLNLIKCQADVTPVLFQRASHAVGRSSGLGLGLGKWEMRDARHRCKKFDALAKWERENQICPALCRPEDILRLYG